MFGKKITPESVRERLIEEQSTFGSGYFMELAKLLTDMHDYQQLARRLCKGK